MNNNEVLQEILMALHAKDKLDEITRCIKYSPKKEFSKEELLKIIEREDHNNDYF